MNGKSEGLNIVTPIGSSGKIRKVKLDLIPSLVEFHWHCAYEGLNFGIWLVVWGSKSSFYSLIIEDLDFKAELFFEIFDDHDQKGKFYSEGFVRVYWGCYVGGADISSNNFQNWWIDIIVGYSLHIPILDLLLPDLKRFGSNGVKDW